MANIQLLFPKQVITTPKNKHIVFINYYWALTSNDEVIIHKWTDDDHTPNYAPQCNLIEDNMKRICQANKCATYELLPMAYIPYYIAKSYII